MLESAGPIVLDIIVDFLTFEISGYRFVDISIRSYIYNAIIINISVFTKFKMIQEIIGCKNCI